VHGDSSIACLSITSVARVITNRTCPHRHPLAVQDEPGEMQVLVSVMVRVRVRVKVRARVIGLGLRLGLGSVLVALS
jgi:hypothetical protein